MRWAINSLISFWLNHNFRVVANPFFLINLFICISEQKTDLLGNTIYCLANITTSPTAVSQIAYDIKMYARSHWANYPTGNACWQLIWPIWNPFKAIQAKVNGKGPLAGALLKGVDILNIIWLESDNLATGIRHFIEILKKNLKELQLWIGILSYWGVKWLIEFLLNRS